MLRTIAKPTQPRRQRLRRALADMHDAQREQEAGQRGVLGWPRSPAIRFSAHLVATLPALTVSGVVPSRSSMRRFMSTKSSTLNPYRSAGVCTMSEIHQRFGEALAQTFDIHRATLGEMQQRLLALRRADQSARAAPGSLAPSSCESVRSHIPGTASASPRACVCRPDVRSSTTRTTSGITSPARRTITHIAHANVRRRATWSALCSVALVTVTRRPPAPAPVAPRGVAAPVRPIWISMASTSAWSVPARGTCAHDRPARRARDEAHHALAFVVVLSL